MRFIVSVLVVQMIPGEAMMFTIYGMIDDWRLMNTLLGLGIVYLGRASSPSRSGRCADSSPAFRRTSKRPP